MINDKIPASKKNFCRDYMQTPEEVDEILCMAKEGYGSRIISKALGISRNTVKKYLLQGGWEPYSRPKRKRKLDGLENVVKQCFLKHKNAEVVRQKLKYLYHVSVNARTVERAVQPYRRLIQAQEKATSRFETLPGKQMQIDFGSMNLVIAGEKQRIYFFVAVLGYSRRQYVQAFLHERQESWFKGLEGAFDHFRGIPEQILLDNAKALVKKHNPNTREVIFNEKFSSFASYWNFTPKACAPFRARTKGKSENTVKYIKRNAIAGRSFASWEDLERHLSWWMREISDTRIHGTTAEPPIQRFLRNEADALQIFNGKPPFQQVRELKRVVHADACIEVDNNFYSVPWRYIKETVVAQVCEDHVQILFGCDTIATHELRKGQGQRFIAPGHLHGIVGAKWPHDIQKNHGPFSQAELLRPLQEYENVVGGGW